MVVISDTTCLTNFYAVGLLHLLPELYSQVFIPRAVWLELQVIPEQAKKLENETWLVIDDRSLNLQAVLTIDPQLHKGECEALSLSIAVGADLCVLDELAGRYVANKLNVPVIGMLGILLVAKRKGLVPAIKPLLNDLSENGFYMNDSLVKRVLRAADE